MCRKENYLIIKVQKYHLRQMAPDSNTNTSLYKIISGALKMPSVLFTQRKDDRARWIYDANILQQISYTDIDDRAEVHF